MDEPWIMTVKGLHSLQMQASPHAGDVEPSNHKLSQKVQNGSAPIQSKSPPKDSNLNHYRSEKVVPSSRPHGVMSSPASTDNRKEIKEKRNSKDINLLDHRGDHQEKSGWKSDFSNANNVSSSSSKIVPSSIRSSCLTAVISPLISEVGMKKFWQKRFFKKRGDGNGWENEALV